MTDTLSRADWIRVLRMAGQSLRDDSPSLIPLINAVIQCLVLDYHLQAVRNTINAEVGCAMEDELKRMAELLGLFNA